MILLLDLKIMSDGGTRLASDIRVRRGAGRSRSGAAIWVLRV